MNPDKYAEAEYELESCLLPVDVDGREPRSTVHDFSIGITFSVLWQPIGTLQFIEKDVYQWPEKHYEKYICILWLAKVGAGILLCQVSEPKEREEDAAGMGAWKIHEANKLMLTNRECCLQQTSTAVAILATRS